MWKVKLRHKDRYNCFQNIIYSMSSFYNVNYQMMMMELWGFKYDHAISGSIGDRLSLCWLGNLERRKELLEKYHGFGFCYERNEDNLVGQISNNLRVSPVGVYIDSFICDWLPFYKKQHRDHICLLLSEEEDKYTFIDEFCKDGEITSIDKTLIEKECKGYVTFYKKQHKEVNNSYYVDDISKLVSMYKDNNMIEQYEKFIYEMVNMLDLSIEVPGNNDPVQSKLIMYLKNISDDRVNFIEALEFIESNTDLILVEPKEHLLTISKGFEKLRLYLIKCCFTKKKPDLSKISFELNKIIELEMSILVYFEKLNIE